MLLESRPPRRRSRRRTRRRRPRSSVPIARPPDLIAEGYARDLRRVAEEAVEELVEFVLEDTARVLPGGERSDRRIAVVDALGRLLAIRERRVDENPRRFSERARDRMAQIIAAASRRLERLARKAGRRTAKWAAEQVEPQLRALGLTSARNLAIGFPGVGNKTRAAVDVFVETNVRLITRALEATQEQIGEMTVEAVERGLRHEELADRIRTRIPTIGSRADLIARNETLNVFSNLTQIRQRAAGVERYRWETALDERVRDWHAELHGTVQAWDNPPVGGGTAEGDVGHPGEGINCRCIAAPLLEDVG